MQLWVVFVLFASCLGAASCAETTVQPTQVSAAKKTVGAALTIGERKTPTDGKQLVSAKKEASHTEHAQKDDANKWHSMKNTEHKFLGAGNNKLLRETILPDTRDANRLMDSGSQYASKHQELANRYPNLPEHSTAKLGVTRNLGKRVHPKTDDSSIRSYGPNSGRRFAKKDAGKAGDGSHAQQPDNQLDHSRGNSEVPHWGVPILNKGTQQNVNWGHRDLSDHRLDQPVVKHRGGYGEEFHQDHLNRRDEGTRHQQQDGGHRWRGNHQLVYENRSPNDNAPRIMGGRHYGPEFLKTGGYGPRFLGSKLSEDEIASYKVY